MVDGGTERSSSPVAMASCLLPANVVVYFFIPNRVINNDLNGIGNYVRHVEA